MSIDNHSSTSKKATITLVLIGVLIIIGIVASKANMSNSEVVQLKNDKTLLELEELKSNYVGVNKDQIIKVTNDGVSAYNLEGQEVWSDTLTLESIWVQQREPYFAVSSKGSRKVSIFSDKGKQGEIVTQNPIVYFSINENGDVATIEEMEEGHIVAAYNSKGNSLGGKRITYISSGGFPIAVEVAPNSKLLLASYVGVNGPKVTSAIEAIPMDKPQEDRVDSSIYGIEQKDNLVYEIEFIENDTWATIGDKYITFYNLEGEKIKTIEGLYASYIPYIHKRPSTGAYLPVVATDSLTGNTLHAKEALHLFNKSGELIQTIPFSASVNYFYADAKGVIVGEGNQYRGYNKLGNQYFEYQATQDISKLIYINNQAIAITKDKVILLKPTRNQ